MPTEVRGYEDNSVSKMANVPSTATVDDVKEAFLLAHGLGCKGTTSHRNQCRCNQPMSTGAPGKTEPRKPGARPEGVTTVTELLI